MPPWVLTSSFPETFVALTVASTLGLGEHYAVDLIAAVPFTAWLVERQWAFRLGPVGDDIAANSECA
jgi:hypothetical protein